ncbi:MAG TPA: hypothetical protein VM266_17215 [Solirubrobacteraceae bacterium]|nr:hypothetical protein [Solirubrobacteraceae bacterium]
MRRRHGTRALAALAVGLTAGVVALEYAHVWRRGHAPLPTSDSEPAEVVAAGREAAIETYEVAVAGYRSGSPRENALLNLLIAYAATAGIVRLSTHSIRETGSFGPFRNVLLADRHIHHFIPGIVLAFLSGGASIISRDERLDRYLAVPFGVGTALTLDEAALLVELEDVYWSERGILSVQVTLAAMALLGALSLGLRLLRRGETLVLEPRTPRDEPHQSVGAPR